MTSITVAITTMRRFSGFLESSLPKVLNYPWVNYVMIGDETGEDIDQIKLQPWGSNPKFIFIKNPERLGAYHNKLNLLKNVTTDWVALIDSDNDLNTQYFIALFDYWKANGFNRRAVYMPAGVMVFNNDTKESFTPIDRLGNSTVTNMTWNSFINCAPSAGTALNLGNCVFPGDVYNSLSENYSKDVSVECKVMSRDLVVKGYTLIFVPDMKYIHIVHGGSLYLSNREEMEKYDRETKWEI